MKKKYIFGLLLGLGVGGTAYKLWRIQNEIQEKLNKNTKYYNLFYNWFKVNQSGQSIANYLEKINCKKIGIYGMGKVGEILLNEIENSSLEVSCILEESLLKGSNDNAEKSDIIIVTPIFDYDNIKKKLKLFTKTRVISIEDLIVDILK